MKGNRLEKQLVPEGLGPIWAQCSETEQPLGPLHWACSSPASGQGTVAGVSAGLGEQKGSESAVEYCTDWKPGAVQALTPQPAPVTLQYLEVGL